MGKLIILRGNSGSGKTTVAKELQKKFGYNTMPISQDEIRRNICADGGEKDFSAVLKEQLITCEMDANSIVAKVYADLLKEE